MIQPSKPYLSPASALLQLCFSPAPSQYLYSVWVLYGLFGSLGEVAREQRGRGDSFPSNFGRILHLPYGVAWKEMS